MFHTITYPRRQPWLPNLSQWVRRWWTTLTPPPAQQVYLHLGDSYHLAAGHYQVQVLAGTIWVPQVGIFSSGAQLKLTVDSTGLAIHTYPQLPSVLAVRKEGAPQRAVDGRNSSSGTNHQI